MEKVGCNINLHELESASGKLDAADFFFRLCALNDHVSTEIY